MPIPKQFANKVLSNLDNAASRLEELAKAGQIDPRVAATLVKDVDAFADRFETAAFGSDSLHRRQAKLISGDADERVAYMGTYDEPFKVHQDGTFHTYLQHTEPGVRWDKGAEHMSGDYYSSVYNRPEYKIRDGIEPGVKQPSMHGEFRTHQSSTKDWAD